LIKARIDFQSDNKKHSGAVLFLRLQTRQLVLVMEWPVHRPHAVTPAPDAPTTR